MKMLGKKSYTYNSGGISKGVDSPKTYCVIENLDIGEFDIIPEQRFYNKAASGYQIHLLGATKKECVKYVNTMIPKRNYRLNRWS